MTRCAARLPPRQELSRRIDEAEQNFFCSAKADLCMNGNTKMMHSHSFVSAVGQEGARTLILQSKRILTKRRDLVNKVDNKLESIIRATDLKKKE